MTRIPHLAERLQGFGTTIFAEVTRAANAHGAVNLGQGFPDFDGPDFVKEAACEAIRAGANQYPRGHGLPALCRAIAAHQRRFWGLDYDPDDEVTVHAGATEAIFAAVQALAGPGDEVLLFEPYYDSYLASVAMAGAAPRVVTLEAPGFRVTREALEAAVTPATRLVLLNTPHNPSGRVLDAGELEAVAGLCRERDLILVSDEVYEHLVFDGRRHRSPAALPGMRERTLVVSSAGKTFSFTGWKVGWSCAPAPLARAVRAAHQFITFSVATPLQHAVAAALERAPDAYYARFVADYRARRDRLCTGLAAVGLAPVAPEGTYFVCADVRGLGFDDGEAFCRRLPVEVGVAAIPCAAFYVNRDAGRHLVRFGFCKSDAVLDEAVARLRRGLPGMRPAPGEEAAP